MKRKSVRIVAIALCLMTAVAFMPAGAFAAAKGSVKINYSISVQGSAKVKYGSVKVTDANGNGSFDIEDAFMKIHSANKKKFAQTDGYIKKFWSRDTSAVGYMINDMSAGSLNDTITNGDYLYGFIYKDDATWSDQYSSVLDSKGKRTSTVKRNRTVKLNASVFGYDANWNFGRQVDYGYQDLTVTVNGKVKKTSVDADGNFKVKLGRKGTYYISVSAAEGIITPANYKLVVKK